MNSLDRIFSKQTVLKRRNFVLTVAMTLNGSISTGEQNPECSPSLSCASLLNKALAVGFGKNIVLGRISAVTAEVGSVFDTMVFKDNQEVRTVAFLEVPDGPLCLVSAGDHKMINLYNISSSEEHRAQEEDPRKPCYSYGPHTKRITHIATSNEGAIIFADKFGEVYRLGLCWSPEHRVEPEGDQKSPATFLLQHFSFFSCVFLSAPVLRPEGLSSTEERASTFCRRLITCDKDCHARVSRFPETYSIEQYLWGSELTQSVVTAITEVPSIVEDSRMSSFEGVRAASATASGGVDLELRDGSHSRILGPRSFFVLGCQDGSIQFWAAKNQVSSHDKEHSFSLASTYKLPSDSPKGGIVGVAYVAAHRDVNGNLRHPEDIPCGVFAAHDQSCEVLFFPLMNAGQHGLFVPLQRTQRVTLEYPIVALRRCTVNSAVALTRAGTLHFIELQHTSVVEPQKDIASQMWSVGLRSDFRMPDMEHHLQEMCGVTHGEQSDSRIPALEGLNLWEQWQNEVVDPRNRKRQHADEGNGRARASSSDSE